MKNQEVALVKDGFIEYYVGKMGIFDEIIVYKYVCSDSFREYNRQEYSSIDYIDTDIITIYLEDRHAHFTYTNIVEEREDTRVVTNYRISTSMLEAIQKTIKQLQKREFGDE